MRAELPLSVLQLHEAHAEVMDGINPISKVHFADIFALRRLNRCQKYLQLHRPLGERTRTQAGQQEEKCKQAFYRHDYWLRLPLPRRRVNAERGGSHR